MKQPTHWRPVKGMNQKEETARTKRSNNLTKGLKVVCCLFFLVVFNIWWFSASAPGWLMYLLLVVPTWLCIEWLFDNLPDSRSEKNQRGISVSIKRVINGIVIGLVMILLALYLTGMLH